MNKIYIEYKEDLVDFYSEPEEYGSWTSTYESEVTRVSSRGDNLDIHRSQLEVNFEPTSGQTIYLVEVTYGDGDSFGHSSGKLGFAGAYLSKEDAEVRAKEVPEDYEKAQKDFSMYTFPWVDYFARIESIQINSYNIL